ncbi:2'-5' RNA ligase [Rhodothermaceae bacterium RA]|nr:2'-5' RNA ligase [Rhodothermaceae bacterium RA]
MVDSDGCAEPSRPMPRLFVALDVTDATRQALAALRDDTLPARWTPPHQYHLTLRFLGEVPDDAVEAIRTALATVQAAPVVLRGTGLGVFPSLRRPRVLFARIDETPALMRLHAAVEAALTRVGLPPDERPFHPHITLARLSRPDARRVRRFRARHADVRIEPMRIDAFTLYASRLGPDGAQHHPLTTYPLHAAPHAA